MLGRCRGCGSSQLEANVVIAKVNDELWDMDRPLETDCTLKLLKFDDPDGKAVRIRRRSGHAVCEMRVSMRSRGVY